MHLPNTGLPHATTQPCPQEDYIPENIPVRFMGRLGRRLLTRVIVGAMVVICAAIVVSKWDFALQPACKYMPVNDMLWSLKTRDEPHEVSPAAPPRLTLSDVPVHLLH